MTELLLTDETIFNLVTEFHLSGEVNRHILARAVAKAQATKAVTGVFERIEKLDFYEGQDPAGVCITRKDFDSLKQELLDEIGGEK